VIVVAVAAGSVVTVGAVVGVGVWIAKSRAAAQLAAEIKPWRTKKYRKKKWILYNTKIKGIELKFDATRDGAYVIMEFNHRSLSRRRQMFEIMEKYRVVFDKYFADAIWQADYEKPCGTIVSRIYRHMGGLDIHKREQWPDFYPFLSKEMVHLERGFSEMKDLFEEDAEI
jgi:hypothetical protein